MLMNEIEISVTLDNPNIIKIYEIFEFNNCVYLVTEYPFVYEVFATEASSSIDWIKQAV